MASGGYSPGLLQRQRGDRHRPRRPGLERTDAVATAARASFLAAFTVGKGYAADADYSARAWLMHQTGITRGAAGLLGAQGGGGAGAGRPAGRGQRPRRGDDQAGQREQGELAGDVHVQY